MTAHTSTGDDAGDDADDQSRVRLLHYADLENVYDHPERVGRLAAAIERRRDERTLVVGAGDDTALGVLALLTEEGRAQARPFFEAVAPDADTFGNHDFDYGDEWVLDWADSVPTTYCCANLDGPGADRVPDATTFERGGTTVGVVGLCHPEKISGTPSDLVHTDPARVAREQAAALREAGAEYVVVTSHCGTHDAAVAAAADVDVVLGGHVHERRTEWVDGTLLVRTAGNGVEFSEVTLGPDPRVTFHATDEGPVAADLTATYRERRRAVGVDETVAVVDDALPRTEVERFRSESRLGNFAADAYRATADADVGVFPAGSLRTGPDVAGEVTVADVVSLCPFGGPVVELDVPGQTLRAELEAMATPRPGRGWVHCHLSGARAVWTEDETLREARVGGDSLDPDATYSVATAAYVVVASDFGRLTADHVVAEHDPQYEALLAHARDGGLDVEREGRISRVPVED